MPMSNKNCFQLTHGENNDNGTLPTIDYACESSIIANRAIGRKPLNCEGSVKSSQNVIHLTRTIGGFDLFGMPMISAWAWLDRKKRQKPSSDDSKPFCKSLSS